MKNEHTPGPCRDHGDRAKPKNECLQPVKKETKGDAANRSLTLSAVGSGDTEQPVVGWRDGVGEQKIYSSGRRRAPALPAGEGSSAWPLHAPGPARVSLPDH